MGLAVLKRRLLAPPLPALRRRLPLLWAPRFAPVRAAVGFDTSGFHDSAGSSVSTLNNTFTIGAALSNGAMVGFLAVFDTVSQITGISMSWNAVAMSQIANTIIFDAGAGSIVLFSIVNPAGGAHSLSASWTGAGAACIGFWTFSGVDQTGGATTFKNGATKNNGGTTSSTTMAVTTTSGNGTVAGWTAGANFSGTQTPTVDWQDNVAGGPVNEGQHILSSSSSSSFTAALGANDFILGCGCDILASGGAAPTVKLGTSRLLTGVGT